VNRKVFIGAAAIGLICTTLAVTAQQAGPIHRIGWLFNDPPRTEDEISKGYPEHLRTIGWIEGKNLVVERRYTGGRSDHLKALAEELTRLKVEVIVAEGTLAGLAAKNATRTIPIVVVRSADPVRAGLVASLAHPGGNVTGTSTMGPDLYQKRVQLLHELLPGALRVGELLTANPIDRIARLEYEQAYRPYGIQPIFIEVTQRGELEAAVEEMARRGAQALRVSPEPLLFSNFPLILRAARKNSLPIIVEERVALEAGALISFGADDRELNRQVALIVDKILGGTRPADIPVRQPTKFELLINLRTAKTLGITVPQALLLRADEVIQ
jgi:putative ABC transport system substrate-binding protein